VLSVRNLGTHCLAEFKLGGHTLAAKLRGLRAAPGDAVLTVTIGPLPGETSVVDNTKNLQLSIHP
jgi:hypothetical protein